MRERGSFRNNKELSWRGIHSLASRHECSLLSKPHVFSFRKWDKTQNLEPGQALSSVHQSPIHIPARMPIPLLWVQCHQTQSPWPLKQSRWRSKLKTITELMAGDSRATRLLGQDSSWNTQEGGKPHRAQSSALVPRGPGGITSEGCYNQVPRVGSLTTVLEPGVQNQDVSRAKLPPKDPEETLSMKHLL